MRLLSPPLENVAIKSILSDDKMASFLLPRLTIEDFRNTPARHAFRRIKNLAAKHGEVPTWDELLEDPVLSEDTRDYFKSEKIRIVSNGKDAKTLINKLSEYRKIRSLYDVSKHIADTIKGDKVDVTALVDEINDRIVGTKHNTNFVDSMVNIGSKNEYLVLIKKMLSGTAVDLLPTGIKAFDDVNGGIPRGAAFVLAASTGGGKSVMATNIGMNRALLGLRVCLISLEMEVEEVISRMLSRLTGIPAVKIMRAKHLDKDDKKTLFSSWKQFTARCRNNGGMLTVVSPEDDLTIEDLLLSVSPYSYDDITVDYLGLCAGMDGPDQWQRLGNGVRFSKRFATKHKCTTTLLAQLSLEGVIRYSRVIQEHAANMWTWTYGDEAKASHLITIKQPKSRNQKPFDFILEECFSTMEFKHVDAANLPKSESDNAKGGRRKDNRKQEDSETYEM